MAGSSAKAPSQLEYSQPLAGSTSSEATKYFAKFWNTAATSTVAIRQVSKPISSSAGSSLSAGHTASKA